jgi:PucR C-terminal helix-turn-helix domain/GGDEF-like domain
VNGLEAQNAVLRQAILVCDRLADACLQGTDLGMLVFLAADFLGRQVVILDPALRTRAAAGPGSPPGTAPGDGARPLGQDETGHSSTAPAGDNPLGWQMTDPRVERLLSTLCASRRPMRVPTLPGWRAKGGTVVAPIAVGELLLGYLAMISDDPPEEESPADEVELLTISHLSTIYALALTRERREQGGPDARRAEVVATLLSGTLDDPGVAAERAASVGLPTAGPLRLLVARPERLAGAESPPSESHGRTNPAFDDRASGDRASRHPTARHPGPRPSAPAVTPESRPDGAALQALRAHLLDELATRIEQLVPGAVAVTRPDEVVALAPEPPSGGRRPGHPTIAERLAREFDRAGFPAATAAPAAGTLPAGPLPIGAGGVAAGMSVGVSSRCHSLVDLGRTYRQTRLALDLVERLGHSGRVVDCDHLGAYRLLLQLGEVDELRSFATEVLGPLIAHDQNHKAELLRTLAAFLDHHGRALPAARALYVHVNTVSYRLRRIETLSGLDLSDPDDRLVAHVALKIVEGLGANPEGPSRPTERRVGLNGTTNRARVTLEPSSNDTRH